MSAIGLSAPSLSLPPPMHIFATAPATCGLIVHRHYEATGGTAFRELFAKTQAAAPAAERWLFLGDDCEREALYGHWCLHHGPELDRLCGLRAPAPVAPACAAASMPLARHRAILEFHAGHPWYSFRPAVPQLRALYRRLGCSFTLFTLLREPAAFVFSFWQHFKKGRQELDAFLQDRQEAAWTREFFTVRVAGDAATAEDAAAEGDAGQTLKARVAGFQRRQESRIKREAKWRSSGCDADHAMLSQAPRSARSVMM